MAYRMYRYPRGRDLRNHLRYLRYYLRHHRTAQYYYTVPRHTRRKRARRQTPTRRPA